MNNNLPQPPLTPLGAPDDLPHYMVNLARRIVRDCHAPGQYVILLDVPHYAGAPKTAVIAKQETIRTLQLDKRNMTQLQ